VRYEKLGSRLVPGVDEATFFMEHVSLWKNTNNELAFKELPKVTVYDQSGTARKVFEDGSIIIMPLADLLLYGGVVLDDLSLSSITKTILSEDNPSYRGDFPTYRIIGVPLYIELSYSTFGGTLFDNTIEASMKVKAVPGWGSHTITPQLIRTSGNNITYLTGTKMGIFVTVISVGKIGYFDAILFLVLLTSYMVLMGIASTITDMALTSGLFGRISKEFTHLKDIKTIYQNSHQVEEEEEQKTAEANAAVVSGLVTAQLKTMVRSSSLLHPQSPTHHTQPHQHRHHSTAKGPGPKHHGVEMKNPVSPRHRTTSQHNTRKSHSFAAGAAQEHAARGRSHKSHACLAAEAAQRHAHPHVNH